MDLSQTADWFKLVLFGWLALSLVATPLIGRFLSNLGNVAGSQTFTTNHESHERSVITFPTIYRQQN